MSGTKYNENQRLTAVHSPASCRKLLYISMFDRMSRFAEQRIMRREINELCHASGRRNNEWPGLRCQSRKS